MSLLLEKFVIKLLSKLYTNTCSIHK